VPEAGAGAHSLALIRTSMPARAGHGRERVFPRLSGSIHRCLPADTLHRTVGFRVVLRMDAFLEPAHQLPASPPLCGHRRPRAARLGQGRSNAWHWFFKAVKDSHVCYSIIRRRCIMRGPCMRNAFGGVLCLLIAASAQAQQTARLTVYQDDRGPQTHSFNPGAHTVRIGAAEHCVYLAPGIAAELAVAGTVIKRRIRAPDCNEARSELLIQGVPQSVTVRSPAGDTSRSGGNVLIRIDSPGSIVVEAFGGGYAAFQTSIAVAPGERRVVRLQLGPQMPGLLADTIVQPHPSAPPAPTPPFREPEPVNPQAELVQAELGLSLMRSARPYNTLANATAIPVLVGLASTAVTGLVVLADSLNEKPEWRKYFGISAAVTVGTGAIFYPSFSAAQSRARRAECPTPGKSGTWASCRRDLETKTASLRTDLAAYPARVSSWQAEQRAADAAHAEATAVHEQRSEQWRASLPALDRANTVAEANRRENSSRLSEWEATVSRNRSLTPVSRNPMPIPALQARAARYRGAGATDAMLSAALQGVVEPRMPQSLVLAMYGQPDRTERDVTPAGTIVRWIYGPRTLLIMGGIVQDIR
jgi:hypothetical protein